MGSGWNVSQAGFVLSLCPAYNRIFFIFLSLASDNRTRCWCLKMPCRRGTGPVDGVLAESQGGLLHGLWAGPNTNEAAK